MAQEVNSQTMPKFLKEALEHEIRERWVSYEKEMIEKIKNDREKIIRDVVMDVSTYVNFSMDERSIRFEIKRVD